MAYFRQLFALLWKDWIVRIRNPCLTFFEVVLPILAILGLSQINILQTKNCDVKPTNIATTPNPIQDDGKIRGESSQDYREDTVFLNKNGLKGPNERRYLAVYYPSNGFTDDLMNELKNLLEVEVIKLNSASDVYRNVTQNKKILKSGPISEWPREPFGLIFESLPTADSSRFEYRLVTLDNFDKDLDTKYGMDNPFSGANSHYGFSNYRLSYGFCMFQTLINEALLIKLTKDKNIKRIETARWSSQIYPQFKKPSAEKELQDLLDSWYALLVTIFIILLYSVMCSLIVKRLTDEKNWKVKELMRMMGMSDFVFWSSHFINYFTVAVIHAIFFTIVLVMYKCPIFAQVNPILFYLVILVFATQMILFCMAVSTIFDRPVMAILGMLIIHLIATLTFPLIMLHPNLGSLPNKKNFFRLISAALPNMALVWDLDLCQRIMKMNNRFGFEELFTFSDYYKGLSVFNILMVQLASMVLYIFLIWYLDSIWPSEYGIAQPFYFLCLPSYYCPNKTQNSTQVARVEQEGDFEADPADTKASITIDKVRKIFNNGKGVHDVSLNIFEGQITALLGHNGAGKTTLMNMITGLYEADSGSIEVNGYDIVSATKKARSSLGLCPQENILFNDLSVIQHLKLFATLKGFPSNKMNEEVNKVLSEVRLEDKINSKSITLSGGMKRRLSLGNAMVGGSHILILDEPSSGLDPEARRGIWDVLQSIRRQRTILLTTHYMEEADVLGDRIFIMSEGRLKCSGTPMFLKKRFGGGYNLRITKLPNFNKQSVDSVLKSHLPDSRVQSEINTEIIYSLESEDKTKESNKDAFPSLFDDIESKKSELGIGSYGIAITTMEDVFLKVGSADEVTEKKDKEHSVPINSQFERLKGLNLLCSQFKGLFLKRFHFWRRYWPLFLFQIFLPVIIFIGIFLLSDYIHNSFKQQNAYLDLVLEDLYPDTKGFFASNQTRWQNFGREVYSPNAKRHKMEIELINGEEPERWLKSLTQKVTEEEYKRKHLLGGGISSIGSASVEIASLDIWWNPEAIHSLPLSINLMYESLIGYLIPNFKDFTIVTRNYPYQFPGSLLYGMLGSLVVNCLLILPFLTPFLAASYVLFPIHERSSKSKFLQLMTGLSAFTFWLCNYLWDITSHIIAIIFIVVVIYVMDGYNVFFTDYQVFLSLISLLLLFGIAAIAMAYFFSFLFKQPPNGFTIIFLISLAIGLIINLALSITYAIDYITERNLNRGIEDTTEDTKKDSEETKLGLWTMIWFIIKWTSCFVPALSFNYGFSKLYIIGSGKSYCHQMSKRHNLTIECVKDNVQVMWCCPNKCSFVGRCFNDVHAFGLKYGILTDLILLAVTALIFFFLVLFFEINCFKCFKKIRGKNVNYIARKPDEDSDIANERIIVNQLIQSGATAQEAIVVVNLTKFFGNFLAVDHLSFTVHKNECFGLLGVNGAGKTTTFTMLTGEVAPYDGTALIDNLDLHSNTKQYQTKIGYCPQFDALLDRLTGEEMLYLFGRLRGIPATNLKSEVEAIIQTTDIKAHSMNISKHYSGGTKRKLSLGISIIGNPSLVFLDEPTAGVDPVARRKIWNTLNELKNSKNSSIILTSHSMEESEALCARIGIMVRGQFKCLGSVQQLRSKFGQGFTLVVKMKRQNMNDKEYAKRVDNTITQRLPSAQLIDSHESLLNYKLNDTSVKWSTMFREMQKVSQELDLEDYTLSDTTLEQIFISFAKQK